MPWSIRFKGELTWSEWNKGRGVGLRNFLFANDSATLSKMYIAEDILLPRDQNNHRSEHKLVLIAIRFIIRRLNRLENCISRLHSLSSKSDGWTLHSITSLNTCRLLIMTIKSVYGMIRSAYGHQLDRQATRLSHSSRQSSRASLSSWQSFESSIMPITAVHTRDILSLDESSLYDIMTGIDTDSLTRDTMSRLDNYVCEALRSCHPLSRHMYVCLEQFVGQDLVQKLMENRGGRKGADVVDRVVKWFATGCPSVVYRVLDVLLAQEARFLVTEGAKGRYIVIKCGFSGAATLNSQLLVLWNKNQVASYNRMKKSISTVYSNPIHNDMKYLSLDVDNINEHGKVYFAARDRLPFGGSIISIQLLNTGKYPIGFSRVLHEGQKGNPEVVAFQKTVVSFNFKREFDQMSLFLLNSKSNLELIKKGTLMDFCWELTDSNRQFLQFKKKVSNVKPVLSVMNSTHISGLFQIDFKSGLQSIIYAINYTQKRDLVIHIDTRRFAESSAIEFNGVIKAGGHLGHMLVGGRGVGVNLLLLKHDRFVRVVDRYEHVYINKLEDRLSNSSDMNLIKHYNWSERYCRLSVWHTSNRAIDGSEQLRIKSFGFGCF